MSDLLLDATGDLDVTDHEITLVTGSESVRQDMASRFRTIKGEWFLDERVGVPYFTDIFVKAPNLPLIRTILNKIALETQGVASIEDTILELDKSTRRLTATIRGTLDESVGDGSFVFEFSDLIVEVTE